MTNRIPPASPSARFTAKNSSKPDAHARASAGSKGVRRPAVPKLRAIESPDSGSKAEHVGADLAGEDCASGGGKFVHRLDPRTIGPSRWANRHPRSFTTNDFQELKSSIEEAGVNVQAIKVRPIVAMKDTLADDDGIDVESHPRFEIVFGHRRHRACLELGLSVAAIVQRMSDTELFAEMDRENRIHKALSPYEQGAMFKQALDSGLYPSARALAQGLGIDNSLVCKSLSIAQLPTEVLQAFSSPLEIQYRWAAALNAAKRDNPQALTARAAQLKQGGQKLSSTQVFRGLIELEMVRPQPVHIAGRAGQAKIEFDKTGRLAIYIATPLTVGQRGRLEIAIKEILEKR